jgi:hypothetical protein
MSKVKGIPMGVILCSKCDCVVDTVDTEKVTVFYGICDSPSCRQSLKPRKGKRKREKTAVHA